MNIALYVVAILTPFMMDQSSARKSYKEVAVADGGSIVGSLKIEGEPPKPKRLDVATKEDVCHADPIYSEKLVVSKERGVQWAVVSIKKIDTGKPFSKKNKPTMDQKGCVFRPHVSLVPARKNLLVKNSDGVLHNVHTHSKKNKPRNVGMPGPVKEIKLKFRRPETLRVTCDVHEWMEAWIVVTEHPYYVTTNAKGEFSLTDVPPGSYTLRLWHESLGVVEKPVTVKAGEKARVDFAMKVSS